MIRTTCPQCGREDALADFLATLPVLCKTCGHRVTMGEPIAPTKPVLPPPPPPAAKASPLPPPKLPPPPPPPPVHVPNPPPGQIDWDAEQPTVPNTVSSLSARAAFVNADGPGKVDLFDDPLPVSRYQRAAVAPHPVAEPTPLQTRVVAPTAPNRHRGRRLAARFISLIATAAALAVGIALVAFAPESLKRDPLLSKLFLFAPFGCFALYQLFLLGTRGQDLGKRVLGLSIQGDDGTPARFGRAFVKRELVIFLLLGGLIPLAWKLYRWQSNGELPATWQRGGVNALMPEVLPAAAAVLFSLLNVAVIFSKDGKCIHDRLAKTTVVRG